jgi:hypothetical protein
MKSNQIKWVIAGGIGLYLYLKWKEGKDDGQIAGFAINPSTLVDSALPWLNINPMIKPFVSAVAKNFVGSVAGFDKSDAIEVKGRRVR